MWVHHRTVPTRRILVLLTWAVACISVAAQYRPGQARTPPAMIPGKLSANNLTMFAYTCRISGWLNYFTMIRNITVFAPENSVFSQLSVKTRKLITGDNNRLYQLVANHLHFHENVYFEDFKNGQTFTMGFGEQFLVNTRKNELGQNDAVWINGLRVSRQIPSSNGVILSINGLITTPTLQLIEFMQYYYGHFGGFEQLLQQSRILYPPVFTILVPINACFKKKKKAWLQHLVNDFVQLQDLVKYHIIPHMFFVDPLAQGRTPMRTLSGKTLIMNRNDSDFFIEVPGRYENDPFEKVKVITPDLRVRSAIIHVIDNILEPYENKLIMEKLGDYKMFAKFVQALRYTKISKILSIPRRKFTVFAPRDSSFDALPADMKARLGRDPAFLRAVLLNHIREGYTSIDKMKDYTQIKTLNGEKMMLRRYGDKGKESSMINDATIDEHDREVANGVIHIVDRVLLPKSTTLWSEISQPKKKGSPYRLSIFKLFLRRTNLWKQVDKDDYYKKMVFAPSDKAFRRLSRRQLRYIMTNAKAARDLMRYHICPGYFHSKLMTEKWVYVFRTLYKDQQLRCRKKRGSLMVFNPVGKNANVIRADLTTKNGLMNVIDRVLIPPSYLFMRYMD